MPQGAPVAALGLRLLPARLSGRQVREGERTGGGGGETAGERGRLTGVDTAGEGETGGGGTAGETGGGGGGDG